jgi:hypothetical protein
MKEVDAVEQGEQMEAMDGRDNQLVAELPEG